MMDEAAAAGGPSVMERLLESVQDEARMRCPAGSPADDPPGVGVDHERDVDEAGPGRDIGEVRDPERVRPGRPELAVDMIQRTRGGLVADRGFDRLATDHALQAHAPHQSLHGASGDILALAAQLPPDLAHAVGVEVLREDTPDLDLADHIPLCAR